MDELVLKWRKDGKNFEKTMKKEEFIAAFEGLIKSFPKKDEHQISKKIAENVPTAIELYINWDSTADVNSIYYTAEDGKKTGIPIVHYHQIVWKILEGYCRE